MTLDGSFEKNAGLAENEAAIKDFTDKSLSGKLKKANVSAGELSKNSGAVRKRIKDSFSKINKVREENGLKALNFSAKAQSLADR